MIRTCPRCGQKNRIPADRLADNGRCGACKTPLPALAEPLDVDPSTFQQIVSKARVPVLVDFWADWCAPCRMAAPAVKQVAGEMAGRALVLKVDTERHPELSARFDVRGIPNFLVFKDGAVVFRQPGLVDHRQLQKWLEQAA